MADREYTIPTPTTAEVNQLAVHMAALDPDNKGLEMRQLRAFYPKLGWGHLLARLAQLRASGRATSKLVGGSGPVPVEIWTLTE